MLKKENRLTTKDIQILSQGKSVFGTFVSLRFSPAPKSRFSVTVNKKVAPRAVDRNRIRRRVYAALEKSLPGVRKPVYALVMPKKECGSVPFTTLQGELADLFKKAGFLG